MYHDFYRWGAIARAAWTKAWRISYLYNFVYWRLYRLNPQPVKYSYWDWVFDLYEDPDIWATHRQDLLTIVEYTKKENIRLMVVIIPNLIEIEHSAPIVTRINDLFQAERIPTLDVTELVQGEPRSVILASPVDPHASEVVHKRIAERLYQIIK